MTAEHSGYPAPAFRMVVDGRDITPTVDARLISRTLTEARSGEADQLDSELSDHDGALAIPSKDEQEHHAYLELNFGDENSRGMEKDGE